MDKRKIIILGATGSIGQQSLDLIRKSNDYELIGFSFNKNLNKALEIINEFNVKMVATFDDDTYKELAKKTNVKTTKHVEELINLDSKSYILNAISGYNGMMSSFYALNKSHNLFLANKESLVCLGPILIEISHKNNVSIIPIDSEHTSLLDLITNYKGNIDKYYITSSGGALRDYSLENLKKVKVNDALNHPTWKMGKKITIDSATMMNKVFEIVEASYLFDLKQNEIGVLMDRTSMVHALIENHGKLLVHKASNDMHLPINYCINYPFISSYNDVSQWEEKEEVLQKYNLCEIDTLKYPLIKLSKDILDNPINGIIINVVNDILVDKFLNEEITYLELIDGIMKHSSEFKEKFIDLEYNIDNVLFIKNYIERSLKTLCKYS